MRLTVIRALVELQSEGWNLDGFLNDPWHVKCDHEARRVAGCVRGMEELPLSLKCRFACVFRECKAGKEVRKQITKCFEL